MSTNAWSYSRRRFLSQLAAGAAVMAMPGFVGRAFAEELLRTPRQTEGPFYPDHLPLDTDNDLLIVNESISQAVGTVTHLSGRILDAQGEVVRNALVEIWQADSNGVYLHSAEAKKKRDSNFQGFGRFFTGSDGGYYFRTIKPVPYGPRTPHIHFKVKIKGKEQLTTQCYIKGFPQNESDFVVRAIEDPKARESVMVDFTPIKESRIGEVSAKFDIVLGLTPQG